MIDIGIRLDEQVGRINPNIYGHFIEHLGGVVYDGIWVGEDAGIPHINGFRQELAEKLKAIKPPVIRWPGGCFAETYNWRDGIGLRERRPVTVNWWYMKDGKLESNHVGTHEFIEFCRLVDAEPYFAVNATTTTVLEARNWIEYCNMPQGTTTLALEREKNGSAEPFNVKYWGLGNENWGGGGCMTPEDYCHIYRKYGIISKSVGPELQFIACGPYEGIPEWTEKFFYKYKEMYTVGRVAPMYGYSLHYYVTNTGQMGTELEYTDAQWYEMMRVGMDMEPFIQSQFEMLQAALPGADVGLIVDEWGVWHQLHGRHPLPGRYLFEQPSTMREAVLAALSLNIFNNQCDKVVMANIAQLVNCIHSLFLAKGDACVATTSYYVFDMFQAHQEAVCLKTEIGGQPITYSLDGMTYDMPGISCSASLKDGNLAITLANIALDEDQPVKLSLYGGEYEGEGSMVVLASSNPRDGNSFEEPYKVTPSEQLLWAVGQELTVTIPKASVVLLKLPVASKP
ncbi:alpha-N-arabinofuranosidase [Paenibacillus thalictri]|uniref:non-reducing end alpha-L-arabinofuranosidase n=1 Tax=Paenibacillus thalictri TaxID=2527873 RepID=A0A4Q9DSC3_9BACL|nr:alpha-L-arabinofuranosidase C-terminal domain-containing protein [Paenibacillus thalictri]TBL78976.1 alpha-L-arabinofuranosidase [Paenibacillus thalictri]